MTDEENILEGRYKLGEEISRDASSVTYRATDLRLGGLEIQIKLLTDYDEGAVAQFYRAAKEAARKLPAEGDMAVADFGCTKEGKVFTTYVKAPDSKITNAESKSVTLADAIRNAIGKLPSKNEN